MKDLLKNKKILFALAALTIIGILIWLSRRGKKEESGFAAPGVPPAQAFNINPVAPPVAPPPIAPPSGGGGIMGVPPPPPPPPDPTPTPPPYPPYPYPYYPGPVYYNPFPRTYIIEDAPVRPRLSNRDYLIKSIAKLEVAYDDAVTNLMLGRAYSISRKIKALERELDRYRN